MTLDMYIGTTYPYLWTLDYTSWTLDSTDPQWTLDGGQVRQGGIVTANDKQINSLLDRLSVTRTENIRF